MLSGVATWLEGGQAWIAGAIIGAASVYVGDAIGNIASGKSGWDVLTPTSSVGTYLGAAAAGMIPGGGLVSVIGRVTVNSGVKHVVNSTINRTPINGKSFGYDLIVNSTGEILSLGLGNLTDKARPQNYSSFKHQLTRRIPHITQNQTKTIMYSVHVTINGIKAIINFAINVATSR